MSGKPEQWAQALGYLRQTGDQVELVVEDVYTSDRQSEFVVETPHKGVEGTPRLRVAAGTTVRFQRQGDALVLQRPDGLDLKLFAQP